LKANLNQFNKIAAIYDLLAKIIFGRAMLLSQIHFFNQVPKNGNVLIIGGGSGWIGSELLKIAPEVTITYIEASENMLSKAKEKLKNFSMNVHFIHGTELSIPGDERYDVVITNFFLDLFPDSKLNDVVLRIRSHLKKKNMWIVTEFVNEKIWWQQMLLWVMYRFFSVMCKIEARKLPSWKHTLQRVGFVKINEHMFYHGFISSSLYVSGLQYPSQASE
jgi:ubiquinone/menaquinone biosynthesis C-methylase UbiE